MSVSVLIVGGGPVGLAMGIALRRWDVDCTLVERHASTLEHPKGRGVSTRTMEIFRQWGLEDEITAVGLPRRETEHFVVAETLLADEFERFDRTALGRGPEPSPTERLICPQDIVEATLLERARTDGVDLRFSRELVALTQSTEGVTACVRDPSTGQATTIDAAFMVAADGGRSTARSLLDVGTTGPGAIGNSVSILVHADLAERVADRLAVIYKVARPDPSAFFAAVDNDRRWVLMMSRDPETQPEDLFTEDHCLSLVRAALGDDRVPLEFKGRWFFQPTAMVADSFRIGRVFLAGDAAHLTTPFGALGMNCGIADAHNLAWKLAGVIHGWAGEAVLDTYEAERRPVATVTSEASILRDVSAGPPRSAFSGVTLGYAYESSAVIPDGSAPPDVDDPVHNYAPTARPGHRAPHVWIEAAGRRTSTLDLFGDAFVALVADEHAAPLVTQGSIPFRSHALPVDAHDAYGLDPGGMVLVRPDGHVAWRRASPPSDPRAHLLKALRAVASS